MSGWRSGKILALGWETIQVKTNQVNYKLPNGMNMWKKNGNITTLLFSLKGLEVLNQERKLISGTRKCKLLTFS